MKSVNFEFLRAQRPLLADLAGFAESYAHADAPSAMVKVRVFLEDVVEYLYRKHTLARPYTPAERKTPTLDDLLKGSDFVRLVDGAVRALFQKLRTVSNPGAHRAGVTEVTPKGALDALRDLHRLSLWLYRFVGWGDAKPFDGWVEVPPGGASGMTRARLQEEKIAISQRLMESQVELTRIRAERDAAQQSADALQARVHTTEAELDALRAKGLRDARALGFDERMTRRLVDEMLAAAGWDVGDDGADTEAVRQEVRLKGFASKSGDGVADYVLYGADGRPVAVVEVKRTELDPDKGREQARRYADALEAQHDQRPIIYYTNGFELWLWDDARGAAQRRVYGFGAPDSLAWTLQQRSGAKALTLVAPDPVIAGRVYQLEALQRVCERFEQGHRRALVVLATGTGKTRVAVSLCDRILRAGRARRILFLCDRRELRKQALNAFNAYLPHEPHCVVDGALDETGRTKHRVFVATYPAMMKCYAAFDASFFDLVIADESHRSIYNRYRDLFLYFDALQLGLTATPVGFVARNTYELFGCDFKVPTAAFSLDEAIAHVPPYLVPPRVTRVDTRFLRDGIKYSAMSAEQRAELEEDPGDADDVEFDPQDVDQKVFNRDTARRIVRNLMEHGHRDAAGALPGKSIVFARNHRHAKFLEEVFLELYPDLGGAFCRVIDNQEPYAERLIDDFKTPANPLRVAISVDMLDTGIDVPEVVNLVFARPVRSYVKFWQMVGRGTRPCAFTEARASLFTPSTPKTHFAVFDHWDNFGFFDEPHDEVEPARPKSLLQQVFEARVELADLAFTRNHTAVFEATLALVAHDLHDLLASRSVSVDEKRARLLALTKPDTLHAWSAHTLRTLRVDAAPLMQWRSLDGDDDAWRFDLAVTECQVERLREGSGFDHARDLVIESSSRLLFQHADVKARGDTLARVASREFWEKVTVAELEAVREELRPVMKHRQELDAARPPPRVIDVTDADERREEVFPKLEGIDLVLYRERVQKVLREHFAADPVLVKIRRGEAVSEGDLTALCDLVMEADHKANVYRLAGARPATRSALVATLRGLVGLDAAAVDVAFTAFSHAHPGLSGNQLRFVQLLQQHIVSHGGVSLAKLYEPPFTRLHAEGIEGVFDERVREELLAAVLPFVVEEAS